VKLVLTVEDNIPLGVLEWCTIRLGRQGLFLSRKNLLIALARLLFLLALLARVLHVGHDGFETACVIEGVVSTTVIEVGDALPLLEHSLGRKLDVDREAVATSALPPGRREPARAHFIEPTSWLGCLVGNKKHNKRSVVIRLEGLDDLLGHDGACELSAGVWRNCVDIDVVLLALKSKRL
jgi:hypothetical protein